MNNQGTNNQKFNVNESNTTAVVCENCGCPVFVEGLMLRKLSILLSPTGKEENIPVPVLICHDCKSILQGGPQ